MSRLLLRVLCGVLFIWQPLNFSVELSLTLPSLSFRGPLAVLELIVHGAVAALSSAAGWALWHSRPHGPSLATLALVCMAGASVQSLYWSRLPSQTQPGTELPLALFAAAHSLVWIVFLHKSSHHEDQLTNHVA